MTDPIAIFMPHGTEARVCAEIAARQQKGIAKYGTTVADNPLSQRQWLQHAYEEALDMSVYLRRAIEELDKQEQRDLDDQCRAGKGEKPASRTPLAFPAGLDPFDAIFAPAPKKEK